MKSDNTQLTGGRNRLQEIEAGSMYGLDVPNRPCLYDMQREAFIFYASFFNATKNLSDKDFGKVFKVVIDYALNGTIPTGLDGVTLMCYELMKPQIDANNMKYLRGKKGGRPTDKKTNGQPAETKEKSETHASFTPPTLDDVRQFISEKQLNVDAATFINHYESNGWMVGKNRMKNWKAAVQNWERRNFTNLNSNQNGNGKSKPAGINDLPTEYHGLV